MHFNGLYKFVLGLVFVTLLLTGCASDDTSTPENRITLTVGTTTAEILAANSTNYYEFMADDTSDYYIYVLNTNYSDFFDMDLDFDYDVSGGYSCGGSGADFRCDLYGETPSALNTFSLTNTTATEMTFDLLVDTQ